MHVLVSGIPLLLLADLVPTNQSSGGVVYEVRATVTLESPEQNVDEGTIIRYAGDLAVYPLVEYEISLGAPAWIKSVYKTVLTLLQNQVEAPRESPAVSSYYEDGVSGYCRVTYEVHSLTNLHIEDRAYNVTKTKHLDDCLQRRHVDSTSNTRRHPADRTKHLANNLLPLPLDNTFENQPFTGRPEDLNKVNSEVTAHEVSYYSVNDSLIESALFDSLTVLPLITGPALVRAQLQLKLASHAAPPMGTAQFDRERRTSLKLNLSEVVAYLNVSAYSDLVVEPEVFTQLLDEVAEELASLELNMTKKSPVIMLKLARIISLLNTEQLKQAMPSSLLNKTSDLEPKEQLLRALYIELLGNARSKSTAQMAIHLMKEHILSRQEAARLFRDLSAFFMTYIDEDTREMLQEYRRFSGYTSQSSNVQRT
ncbi:hypothetical protein HPB52_015305 [Rhipicephalus sanguineus]|uniref:Vitellogenin domain-containing protein n=1 Tax=Rhipicephalus sanguineus TaxID=34632 RepID=A0A9D4SPD2_RHISA|nr:hypothetical protein HPB52_015305 [Rhipicephalus sanguineus]